MLITRMSSMQIDEELLQTNPLCKLPATSDKTSNREHALGQQQLCNTCLDMMSLSLDVVSLFVLLLYHYL